jgi:hypothetical protein
MDISDSLASAMVSRTIEGRFRLLLSPVIPDEKYSEELKRHTRCVRLISLSTGDDPLPRLEDAVVVFVHGDVLTQSSASSGAS